MFWPSRQRPRLARLLRVPRSDSAGEPGDIARFGMPELVLDACSVLSPIPRAAASIELTGADPDKPVRITENGLSHPEDVALARKCIAGMREVGNAAALRPFTKREVMPGDLKGEDLDRLRTRRRNELLALRRHGQDGPRSAWPSSTAASRSTALRHLRVADGSIMPRITAGNTMAPCVVIGERAAEEIKAEHRLAEDTVSR